MANRGGCGGSGSLLRVKGHADEEPSAPSSASRARRSLSRLPIPSMSERRKARNDNGFGRRMPRYMRKTIRCHLWDDPPEHPRGGECRKVFGNLRRKRSPGMPRRGDHGASGGFLRVMRDPDEEFRASDATFRRDVACRVSAGRLRRPSWRRSHSPGFRMRSSEKETVCGKFHKPEALFPTPDFDGSRKTGRAAK